MTEFIGWVFAVEADDFFAAVVAAIVLGEPLRGSRIPAIGLGIVGAVIIIRPGIIDVNIGVLYVLGW